MEANKRKRQEQFPERKGPERRSRYSKPKSAAQSGENGKRPNPTNSNVVASMVVSSMVERRENSGQRKRQGQNKEQGQRQERTRKEQRKERRTIWILQRKQMRSDRNFEDAVLRRFRGLRRGATRDDATWLLRMDVLRRHVYLYDHESRSVSHPGRQSLIAPWPVVLLLGRYNRKHIICSKQDPKADYMRDDVLHFCTKLRWRWFLRDEVDRPIPYRIKASSCPMACLKVIDPGLSIWIDGLRHHVNRGMQRARSSLLGVPGRAERLSNHLPLLKFAKQLLIENKHIPVLTDKDGGYALEHVDVRVAVHREIVNKKV